VFKDLWNDELDCDSATLFETQEQKA